MGTDIASVESILVPVDKHITIRSRATLDIFMERRKTGIETYGSDGMGGREGFAALHLDENGC
ncbi:hypothetical protein D3C78_1629600 [compost metagenome]